MASAGFIGVGPSRLSRRRGLVNFISDALDYETDNLRLKLSSVNGGGVADTLELTTFEVNDTDNLVGVTEDLESAELSDTTAPGALTGASGQKVAAMSSVAADTLYVIAYTVTAADAGVTLFYPSGGPFGTGNLPSTVGEHRVLVTSEDTDTGNAINKGGTGDITISALSIKRAEWNFDTSLLSAGDKITYQITRGDVATPLRTVYMRAAGELYVSGSGSDTRGTGAELSPYRQISKAGSYAVAGDDIIIGAGTYASAQFEDLAGTDGNPITFTTPLGEENLAIIRGDLRKHVAQGGTGAGVPADFNDNEANRDGLRFARCDYITIKNLRFEDFWRAGLFITGGAHGTTYGDFIIEDNIFNNTGSSSAVIQGKPGTARLLNSETTPFLQTISFTGNTCQFSNQPNDYFNHIEGVTGADTEMLSMVWGVDDIDVDNNVFEDGANYGPDFKAGVSNFTFTNNIVRRFRKYGVYCDTANLWVTDGVIANNTVSAAQIGICKSREAAPVPEYADYAAAKAALGAGFFQQTLARIDTYNNLVFDCDEAGIRNERHPTKDGPDGEITDISDRFNTLVDNNRSGTAKDLFLGGWADADFLSATIATGYDFIGNLIWNSTADIDVTDEFTGETGFTVDENFNLADGAGTDPNFIDPDNGDYGLQDGSAAEDVVTTAGYIAAPFDTARNGNLRVIPAAAGQWAPEIPAPVWVVDPALLGTDVSFTGSASASKLVWAFSATTPTYTEAGGWVSADEATGSQALVLGENTLDIDSVDTPAGDTTLWLYLVSADGKLSVRKSLPVTIVASNPIVIRASGINTGFTAADTDGSASTNSVTVTGDAIADVEILLSIVFANATKTFDITVGGVTPTLVASNTSTPRAACYRYRLSNVAANTTADIVITPTGGALLEQRTMTVVSVEGSYTSDATLASISFGDAFSLDVDTVAGGIAVGVAATEGTTPFTWTGLTLTDGGSTVSTLVRNYWSVASLDPTVSATPLTITATRSASSSDDAAALVVTWTPS